MSEQQNHHGARRMGAPAGERVNLIFEGTPVEAFSTDMIASALLSAGVRVFMTTDVAGEQRGGFCFVGRCADCLVIVDGQANQRACLTPVQDGMEVRAQHGRGSVERENQP